MVRRTRDSGERPTGGRRRRRSSARPESDGTPRSLSEEVEAQAEREARHVDDPVSEEPSAEEEGLDFSPSSHAPEAQGRGTEYAKEYRLQLLHRLLMRRVPLPQIAEQLGVDVSTVTRDRKELYKRLRQAAKSLDIHDLIGDTLGFYNEVTAMALRGASLKKTPMTTRLAALRTALASKNHMTRFLEDAGVFEVLKFQPTKTEGKQDLEKIVEVTNALLESDTEAATGLSLPEGTLLDDEEEIELL